jgi:hypothetical protein
MPSEYSQNPHNDPNYPNHLSHLNVPNDLNYLNRLNHLNVPNDLNHLNHPNHLNLSREIHELVSEADFTGTIQLNHMPFLRHDTYKPEHSFAIIFVLVPAAGRNIGIGSDFYGRVFAINMQGAPALKYIVDVGPVMGVPRTVPAFGQFDHPHDIAFPALFR